MGGKHQLPIVVWPQAEKVGVIFHVRRQERNIGSRQVSCHEDFDDMCRRKRIHATLFFEFETTETQSFKKKSTSCSKDGESE